MTIYITREQRRQMERANAKLPTYLQGIPRADWPANLQDAPVWAVWRSRDFLVQAYKDEHESVLVRLSIHRTTLDGDRWKDGITWDELQNLKCEAGFAEFDAVEVYPPAHDLVNVANIRHLWVMREKLPFAWRQA